MSRWLGAAAVIGLLVFAWLAYQQDRGVFGLSSDATLNIVWMVMALLLVSGAGRGFQRLRQHKSEALAGALFWAAAVLILIVGYRIFMH